MTIPKSEQKLNLIKIYVSVNPIVVLTMEETDFFGERTKDAYNFALRINDNADINAIRNTLNLSEG